VARHPYRRKPMARDLHGGSFPNQFSIVFVLDEPMLASVVELFAR